MEAKSQTEKPSIIIMRTTIGCGSGSGIEGASSWQRGKWWAFGSKHGNFEMIFL